MIRRSSQVRAEALAALLLLLATLGACSAQTRATEATATPVAFYPTDTGDTARHLATFVPTDVPTPMYTNLTPANTSGWAIYRDQMFPFQMPIPPRWRYGAFVENREGQANCQEVVGFLPPNSTGPIVDGFAEKQEELIVLYVTISCTPYDPAGNPHNALMPSQAEFGGTTVNWYYSDLPPYSSSRVAVATFGDRGYDLALQAPTANAPRDIALYLGMMKDFRYLG